MQEVLIDSQPQQAIVLRDGNILGSTPILVRLHKKELHQLELRRKHFEPAVLEIAPTRNERGKADLRLGPLEEIGLYHDLTPNPAFVLLKPELEPLTYGPDRFRTYTDAVSKADLLLREGELTEEEHAYIIERLITFFSR